MRGAAKETARGHVAEDLMSSNFSGGFRVVLLSALVLAGCNKGPSKHDEPMAAAAPGATGADMPVTTPGATVDGTSFGAGVKLVETTPIERILAEPAAFKGKTVRVEGMVTDVCQKRGCWFEMAGTAPGQKLRFKVTDGEMVFPVDTKGKYAVAEGQIAIHELSLEQTRAYAEEQATENGATFDPASVTKPTVIVRIDGTGAVLRDKK